MKSRDGFMAVLIAAIVLIMLAVAGGSWWYYAVHKSSSGAIELQGAETSTHGTNSSTPLFSFIYPTQGAQIDPSTTTTITWSAADPTIIKKFSDLGIQLSVANMGGSAAPLNTSLIPLSQASFSWNVAQTVGLIPSLLQWGPQYRIVATLQYNPHRGNATSTCDPSVKGVCDPIYSEPLQSEITAAKQYTSESDLFILKPAAVPEIPVVSAPAEGSSNLSVAGWKTQMVYASQSPAICYSIEYPSDLIPQLVTYNAFFKSSAGGGIGTSGNVDLTWDPSKWSSKSVSFDAGNGLVGLVATGSFGYWTMGFPASENGTSFVIGLWPLESKIYFSLDVAKKMAQSIRLGCVGS